MAHSHTHVLVMLGRHKVIGVILVKELAMVDKSAKTPVSSLKMRSLPFLRGNTPLYDLLRLFETGRCHMAVLTEPTEPKEGAQPPSLAPPDPSDPNQPHGALQRQPSDGMHAHLLQGQHPEGLQNGYATHQHAPDCNPGHLTSTDHEGTLHDEVSSPLYLLSGNPYCFWLQL